jgi:SAM-dependent methyltransferase
MKKPSKRLLIVFILYIVIGLFALREILISSGHIFLTIDSDVPPFGFQFRKWSSEQLFIWNTHNLGYRLVYPSGLWFYLGSGLIGEILGVEVFLRFFLLLSFVFSAFFMFILIRHLNISDAGAFFGGFFYSFSPVMFTHVTSGRELFMLGYTLTPVMLYFVLNSIRQNSVNKVAVIFGGILFGLACSQLQFFVIAFFFSFIFLVFMVKAKAMLKLKVLVALISIGILLHMFWILPSILNPFPASFVRGKFSVEQVTGTSLLPVKAFTLSGYIFPFFEQAANRSVPLWPILAFSVVAFVFSPLFLVTGKNNASSRRIKMQVILFSLIALLSIFFVFAPLIFPSIVLPIYQGFPFAALFRQVYYLTYFTIFSYSILFAFSFENLLQCKLSPRVKYCGVLLVVTILILANYPLFTGNLGGFFPSYQFEDYKEVAKDLQADYENDFRVIWLPMSWLVKYDDTWPTWGGDNFARYTQAMLTPSEPAYPSSINMAVDIYDRLYHDNDTFSLAILLGSLDVKYIVVRENTSGAIGEEVENVTRKLLNSNEFILVKSYNQGSVLLFENKYFKQKFYALHNLSIGEKPLLYIEDIGIAPTFTYPGVQMQELPASTTILNDASPINLTMMLIPKKYYVNLSQYLEGQSNPYNGWVIYNDAFWEDTALARYVEFFDQAVFTKTNATFRIPLNIDVPDQYLFFLKMYPMSERSELSVKIFDARNRQLEIEKLFGMDGSIEKIPQWFNFSVALSKSEYDIEISNCRGACSILNLVAVPMSEIDEISENLRSYENTQVKESLYATRENSTQIKEYRKNNPALWTVRVNTSQPFMLSFSESYDPLWQARVYKNNKLVENIEPLPLYDVINGFWINTVGENLRIVIEYRPQKLFDVGLAFSCLTFVASFVGLIFYSCKDHNFILKNSPKRKPISNLQIENCKWERHAQLFTYEEDFEPFLNHIKILRKNFHPKTCLDIGCGDGRFLGAIGKNDTFAVGVELSKTRLRKARNRYLRVNNVQVVLADASYLPFKGSSFDGVFMIELLEHLTRKQRYDVLIETRRVMRKFLFATTPNPLTRHARIDSTHILDYSAGTLRTLMKNVFGGFKVLVVGSHAPLAKIDFWRCRTAIKYILKYVPYTSTTFACFAFPTSSDFSDG